MLKTFAKLEPLARHIAHLSDEGFCDVCYIHNDIYWGNLIFDSEDELIAFIDFDKLEVSSWLYEVGCAASICATTVANIRTFIASYEDQAGIKLNINLLVLAMLTKTIRSSLWCILVHLRTSAVDQSWLEAWSLHLENCLNTIQDFAQTE